MRSEPSQGGPHATFSALVSKASSPVSSGNVPHDSVERRAPGTAPSRSHAAGIASRASLRAPLAPSGPVDQRRRPPLPPWSAAPQGIRFRGTESISSVHLIDQDLPADSRLSQRLKPVHHRAAKTEMGSLLRHAPRIEEARSASASMQSPPSVRSPGSACRPAERSHSAPPPDGPSHGPAGKPSSVKTVVAPVAAKQRPSAAQTSPLRSAPWAVGTLK